MSNAYTSDGRRISSMTHAKRGHQCEFCDMVAFGNGGSVAHSRSHVRRGEVVELVKHYPDQSPGRIFLRVCDKERIQRFLDYGYEKVAA